MPSSPMIMTIPSQEWISHARSSVVQRPGISGINGFLAVLEETGAIAADWGITLSDMMLPLSRRRIPTSWGWCR